MSFGEAITKKSTRGSVFHSAVAVLAFGVVLNGCSVEKVKWQEGRRSHAPLSKDDLGSLVTLANPDDGEALIELSNSSNLEVRTLYKKNGLYEVFAPVDQVQKTLQEGGISAVVEKNIYSELENKKSELNFSNVANAPAADSGDFNSLEQCKEGQTPPTISLVPTKHLSKLVFAPFFLVGEGPFEFDGSESISALGEPVQLLWMVQAPDGSVVNLRRSTDSNLRFQPDIPGEYRVMLFGRDKEGVCDVMSLRFAITDNQPFKGAKPAREITAEDQSKFSHLSAISAEKSWRESKGEGVLIAVVDSGVNYNHPDLSQNAWVNTKEVAGNGLDDDQNGFIDDVMGWDFAYNDPSPFDDQGHGTHVASLAASAVMGVAPKAKVMAIKAMNTFGGGDIGSLAAGVRYAVDNGADIINCSFSGPSDRVTGIPQMMKDALKYAEDQGVIVVAAAGNGDQRGLGFDIDRKPRSPASATNSNVVTVAATTKTGELTSYSNFGISTVDVAAPGGSNLDGDLLGAHYLPHLQIYMAHSGTSMASPVVAGVLAQLKSLAPDASHVQIIEALSSGGHEVEELKLRVKSGKMVDSYLAIDSLQKLLAPVLAEAL